jgi:hypothetical protein
MLFVDGLTYVCIASVSGRPQAAMTSKCPVAWTSARTSPNPFETSFDPASVSPCAFLPANIQINRFCPGEGDTAACALPGHATVVDGRPVERVMPAPPAPPAAQVQKPKKSKSKKSKSRSKASAADEQLTRDEEEEDEDEGLPMDNRCVPTQGVISMLSGVQ